MKLGKTLLFSGLFLAGTAVTFATSADAAETYTVKSGDTLSGISQAFVGDNSLIEKIAADNQIANIHLIYVGEQLTIDVAGEGAPVAETTETEAVVPTTEPVDQTQTQETVETTVQAPVEAESTTQNTPSVTTTDGSESSAKEWIAQKESGGSYSATNGRYIGRYQLDSAYLNGDYSTANQERVAENYVSERYGSWSAAQAFWQANGWY